MMASATVEIMDSKGIADNIREFADEVERGNFIAVAFAICDKEGNGGDACCVDQHIATPGLIDEILHSLKVKLFDALEDRK